MNFLCYYFEFKQLMGITISKVDWIKLVSTDLALRILIKYPTK